MSIPFPALTLFVFLDPTIAFASGFLIIFYSSNPELSLFQFITRLSAEITIAEALLFLSWDGVFKKGVVTCNKTAFK
jgi:hypothetical protein